MKFLHLSYKKDIDHKYWKIDGDRMYNILGTWRLYEPKINDEIVEADSWDEIMKMAALESLDSTKITGWIDPEGNFYGCDSYMHDRLAEFLFGHTEFELEQHGYIKIYEIPLCVRRSKNKYGYHSHIYPTEFQKVTLKEKGFEVDD